MLTPYQYALFQSHIQLESVGINGQHKLKASHVVCIGAGGLGSIVAGYLARAGIGQLTIIDGDTVCLDNLPRQIFFQTSDIGKAKVDCLREVFGYTDQQTLITTINNFLTDKNVEQLLSGADLVIDCTDNVSTTYIVSDYCSKHKLPMLSASVIQHQGLLVTLKGSPCYRCLFAQHSYRLSTGCTQTGVLNTLVGWVGLLQAHQALRILLSLSCDLYGHITTINGRTLQQKTFSLDADPQCKCNRQSPSKSSAFGQVKHTSSQTSHTITADYFLTKYRDKQNTQLIDVRSRSCYSTLHLPKAKHCPEKALFDFCCQFTAEDPLILYCSTGTRSPSLVAKLRASGWTNSFDIAGGIRAFV